jgi:Icc protein
LRVAKRKNAPVGYKLAAAAVFDLTGLAGQNLLGYPMRRLSLLFVAVMLPLFGGESAPFRIALLSDPHTTRGVKQDQPLYRGRFDAVIAQVNAAQVNVVLVAGDLTQQGLPDEIADFKAEVARLRAPVLWVPGNHDIGSKRIPGVEGGTTEARVAGYEAELGPSFYVRTLAGVRLIGLNSSIFGSGFARERAMWDLLEAQMANPAPGPTVVFMHYPPYVHSPDEKGGTYWDLEPAPRARLLALLRQGGVKVLLTGHLHYQLRNTYDGMVIVTTAPISFGLPRGVAPQGWTLVTLSPQGEPGIEFYRVP